MSSIGRLAFASVCLAVFAPAFAQTEAAKYKKIEYMIPMRDGRKLYTAVYVPSNRPGKHPILMERTPYSSGPYGPEGRRGFSGSRKLQDDGFIFAFQDVRGKYMSEGEFVNVRPQLANPLKPTDVDESTDTWDTVEYLIKNVPDNNQNVGIRGISYPGGYAALAGINSHPNLKCISPQAPTADWFIGDDFHHNGAFFLQDAFSFMGGFGQYRPAPSPNGMRGPSFDMKGDAYKFFLELGPLSNVNKDYFKDTVQFWNDMMRHGTYDEFWQSRSIPNNMKNVKCAVLSVGGLFDAEDCWGPQYVYRATEKLNPKTPNFICLGPWSHGQWMGVSRSLGDIDFGADQSAVFKEKIEYPFLRKYLMGDKVNIPEAQIFNTGANVWRTFPAWPPKGMTPVKFQFGASGKISLNSPVDNGKVIYTNDPANPTPYQGGVNNRRTSTYMLDDQRFASARNDVVTFQTEPLQGDLTIAGPVTANLQVAMTGTDADFVVKVIDVLPEGHPDFNGKKMAEYQMLVRGEVMRGKFRDSWQNPSPFLPNRRTLVRYTLPDVLHTFKKGHRVMIQVQSSWFPLVDRNTNQFQDIYAAKAEDFIKNDITVFFGNGQESFVEAGTLK